MTTSVARNDNLAVSVSAIDFGEGNDLLSLNYSFNVLEEPKSSSLISDREERSIDSISSSISILESQSYAREKG